MYVNQGTESLKKEFLELGFNIDKKDCLVAFERILSFTKQKLKIALQDFSINDLIEKTDEINLISCLFFYSPFEESHQFRHINKSFLIKEIDQVNLILDDLVDTKNNLSSKERKTAIRYVIFQEFFRQHFFEGIKYESLIDCFFSLGFSFKHYIGKNSSAKVSIAENNANTFLKGSLTFIELEEEMTELVTKYKITMTTKGKLTLKDYYLPLILKKYGEVLSNK